MRRHVLLPLASLFLAYSCGFDRTDRWLVGQKGAGPLCTVGDLRCTSNVERCESTSAGPSWRLTQDCASQGLVCAPDLWTCKTCVPNTRSCEGQTPMVCDSTGDVKTPAATCDNDIGQACRTGQCVDLCNEARTQRSNVGCEYWAADLDNADVSASLNAASQQYAVVVSNPEPDVTTRVQIDRDDTQPGDANQPVTIATANIPPLSLRVFLLGPREVDGSPPGEFNTGTGSALTRQAYRITTDFPVVAYQFNPLANVNVFSNDASLLKPVEALGLSPGTLTRSYVVLGWPQTIAATDDPNTNFNPSDPINLRAFITIVGTRDKTKVRVETKTQVLRTGPAAKMSPDGVLEVELDPFDVLNLETDGFNADFTGSVVSADQPVVVFSGSEASDAPYFQKLSQRDCCADHLEEQLDPLRTAGKRFVASVSANRSELVSAAGATIGVVEQPEYFRVIAATDKGATVTTTLGGAYATLSLPGFGSYTDIVSTHEFMLSSDNPVQLESVSASQDACGIPTGLPGGDPSSLIVPPIEQFRKNYVFLTPDKYNFDYVRIVTPTGTNVVMDGTPVDQIDGCVSVPADGLTAAERGSDTPPMLVWRCQLSFPVIDPQKPTDKTSPGLQNDGVHRIDADEPVGVLVEGFDSYVSYAYAAGTELSQIVPE